MHQLQPCSAPYMNCRNDGHWGAQVHSRLKIGCTALKSKNGNWGGQASHAGPRTLELLGSSKTFPGLSFQRAR